MWVHPDTFTRYKDAFRPRLQRQLLFRLVIDDETKQDYSG